MERRLWCEGGWQAVAAALIGVVATLSGLVVTRTLTPAAMADAAAPVLHALALPALVLSGVTLFAVDRSHRRNRRLQQTLEQEIQTSRDLLAVATHELRAPLTAVRLTLDVLQRRLLQDGSDDWLQGKLTALDTQTQRMADLVDDLARYYRAVTQGPPARLQVVDLAALVRSVLARYDEMIAAAGCTITLSCHANPKGRWDANRVEQIVINLLSNAVKYGAGRPIEIRINSDDQFAHFSVRDQGIGIAPEDQQRIFERLARTQAAERHDGLGLGLWIVRRHVEDLHGQILVASAAGQGSTFIVQLPLGRDSGTADLSTG